MRGKKKTTHVLPSRSRDEGREGGVQLLDSNIQTQTYASKDEPALLMRMPLAERRRVLYVSLLGRVWCYLHLCLCQNSPCTCQTWLCLVDPRTYAAACLRCTTATKASQERTHRTQNTAPSKHCLPPQGYPQLAAFVHGWPSIRWASCRHQRKP